MSTKFIVLEAEIAAHLALAQCFSAALRASGGNGTVDHWLSKDLLQRAWHLAVLEPSEPEVTSLHRLLNLPQEARRSLHDSIFGLLISRDCPPYETEYLELRETTYISQQMADIAGFYRAFGLEPSQETPERVDHLSLELDFVSHLLARLLHLSDLPGRNEQQTGVVEDALRKFVGDHLAWWIPLFSLALETRVKRMQNSPGEEESDLFLDVALALKHWFLSLCEFLGVTPSPPAIDEIVTADGSLETAGLGCLGCDSC